MIDWNNIFSPDEFIADMLYRGEIEQWEIDNNLCYGEMVCKLCHNSVSWMYLTVMENYFDFLDQLFLVTGSYCIGGNLRLEHSWIEYRDGDKVTVIDLTLSQFQVTKDRLYIGDRTDKFIENDSSCFNDRDNMKRLILSF